MTIICYNKLKKKKGDKAMRIKGFYKKSNKVRIPRRAGRQVSVYLSFQSIDRLKEISDITGKSVSRIIEELIEGFLHNLSQKKYEQ